jgi:hypothetical protein
VHIPNNTDITASYRAGKVIQEEGCIPIRAVDHDLVVTRKFEKKFKLNVG